MKRFIDLRGQGTYSRFAWFDTVVDRFEDHGGSMAWDCWADFERDCAPDKIERYRRLVPDWVFEPDPESKHEYKFWGK